MTSMALTMPKAGKAKRLSGYSMGAGRSQEHDIVSEYLTKVDFEDLEKPTVHPDLSDGGTCAAASSLDMQSYHYMNLLLYSEDVHKAHSQRDHVGLIGVTALEPYLLHYE